MKAIEAIKSINYKDVAARAAWTFVQAFVACFIVAAESIINSLFAGDWTVLRTVIIATVVSAFAAGLSAVKTVVLETVRAIKAKSEE